MATASPPRGRGTHLQLCTIKPRNKERPMPHNHSQLVSRELTFRVIILSIILAALLAVSNAYLALKVGILTSASIPAAVLSIGILRRFKNANLLENNLVQTAASAGEAVAGGIVFTVPALIVLHYWHAFPYWQNVAIAVMGGTLGVLFSVPIRKPLVSDPHLPFPEGSAIAEVLQLSESHGGLREILVGGVLGSLLELAQTGLGLIASHAQYWLVAGRSLITWGGGFSAALVGAGYLMGIEVVLSILLGAAIASFIEVPFLSHGPAITHSFVVTDAWLNTLTTDLRFIGIGAMLTAGFWTLGSLFRPVVSSLRLSWKALNAGGWRAAHPERTERDIPLIWVILGVFIIASALPVLFAHSLNVSELFGSPWQGAIMLMGGMLYVIIVGFILAAVCGYFSGLVGVTASPGSSIIIGGLLIAAVLIRLVIHDGSEHTLMLGAVATVLVGSIVAGIAALADNLQDLKVGYIVGATPWKQQCMLLLGVLISALVIPPVLQILFDVYGIGDVLPRVGMDPAHTLSAPPAMMVAAVTQAVFHHAMPWHLLRLGAEVMGVMIVVSAISKRFSSWRPSLLGVAIGMYLPLASSIPLVLGGVMAYLAKRGLSKRMKPDSAKTKTHLRRGYLLACGLVTGSALMSVVLALPMAMTDNLNVFRIVPNDFSWGVCLGVLSIVGLGCGFYRAVNVLTK